VRAAAVGTDETRTSARADEPATSRRRTALVVLVLLLAALFAYPGSGLLLGWSSTVDGGIHMVSPVRAA
jgi:hypothetical protein